ncbi:DUF2141 domain-containing protein [Aquimarina sp. D1M17]|uniref:DUF2141 domain-containing protein n=1 Tax=Aquimarina acroporae TaxID=2937283 RepID=UPI0020BDA391|nr:DUF2141 domain-containing protein [Aquimarina acroporae]MCK8522871.1 DUF2141 domain-containing protein [Aquimarina acroporae]
MKTLAFLIALLISNFIVQAQTPDSGITITVTVPNVTGSEGDVLFALYNEATFMKAAPVQSAKSEIENGTAKVTFTNVPVGEYGITCLHDTNGNGRMDFEANGMPKENYGVSNNNMSYGPPMWGDAKFEVGSEDLTLEIRL